jgi:glycosyltransferase involved in cell wall biosynthesis
MKPRFAFVVQRYGETIAGGSEQLCRTLAGHMSRHADCEIITTCAEDYMTWKNVFPPGVSQDNGVRVRRFPVDEPRNLEKFNALSDRVFARRPHTIADEENWMRLQGPYSSELLDHLKNHRDSHDVFVFLTYLYATTYFGLPLVKDKAVLVPTAHDEPPIYLSIFDSLFHAPRRLLFLTAEEREFTYRRFSLPENSGAITGIGLEPPRAAGSLATGLEEQLRGNPFLLYLGRIDPSKGCGTLIEHFTKFIAEHPKSPLWLVLAGKAAMEVPDHARIIAAGYLSEEEKAACIEASIAMVAPSPYESLCLAALEAWAHSKPVLANGECEVLVGQCRRSGGGLWYRNYEEFEQCLALLAVDSALRRSLGAAGASFVTREYGWDGAETRYLQNILWAA